MRERFPLAMAAILAALLFTSILTGWIQAPWPVSLLQTGAFLLLIAYVVGTRTPLLVHPMMAPLAAILVCGTMQFASRQTVYRWDTGNALLFWGANLALFTVSLQIFVNPRPVLIAAVV